MINHEIDIIAEDNRHRSLIAAKDNNAALLNNGRDSVTSGSDRISRDRVVNIRTDCHFLGESPVHGRKAKRLNRRSARRPGIYANHGIRQTLRLHSRRFKDSADKLAPD